MRIRNTMTVRKKMKIVGMAYLFLYMASSVMCIAKLLKKGRRWHTRPVNRNRDTEGIYATLIRDMWQLDEDQFFIYTRMTPGQFKYLLELVQPYIQKDKKKRHISPEHRLIMTLHYLSEGCSMQEIAFNNRIGKSTAHCIIKETCRVIWETLQPIVLPSPTRKHFDEVAAGFYSRWNLPNCIGAVDGKHINIVAPKKSGSTFFNYKKTFSIVLMATCDAYYRFSMVDIGAEGAHHDSTVFKSSGLGSALLKGELDIPPPKELPHTNVKVNHFLVADAAFPMHDNILRPYPGKFLDEKKNIFNYRLSRGRRCIENAFGILSQRWRVLRRTINASIEMCELITQATVVLHNFLQSSEIDLDPADRKYCPTGYADYCNENGQFVDGSWRNDKQNLRSLTKASSNNYTRSAKNIRDTLAEYFISKEGWLPWQEDYVNRGGAP